jgi:hypothetical protein
MNDEADENDEKRQFLTLLVYFPHAFYWYLTMGRNIIYGEREYFIIHSKRYTIESIPFGGSKWSHQSRIKLHLYSDSTHFYHTVLSLGRYS